MRRVAHLCPTGILRCGYRALELRFLLATERDVYMFETATHQRGYNEEACFNCQCVRNEHGCVGSSTCRLLGHSLDERLLSDLEQFNSLEAIPQRLQKGARPVPNLWRSYGRQNASGRAPRMLVAEVQRVSRWVPD